MLRAILLLALLSCSAVTAPPVTPLHGGWYGYDRDIAFYADDTFLYRRPATVVAEDTRHGWVVYVGTYEQGVRTLVLTVTAFQPPGGTPQGTHAVWIWRYRLDGDVLTLNDHVYQREA